MSTGKRISLLVLALLLALAAFVLYPKPCEEAPAASGAPQCHCAGMMVVMEGSATKQCIGLALKPSTIDAE